MIKYLKYIFLSFLILVSCSKEDPQVDWVDLRYDVPEDTYIIDAEGTQTVNIRVKSSQEWTVFGKNAENWYNISPDNGGPGEIYSVTITCEPNTGLDNRSDTLIIKSSYWVGKEFILTQKGCAYLECTTPAVISAEGCLFTLEISSNQPWTAQITSGDEWLVFNEGKNEGNGNGKLVIDVDPNAGEIRDAEITLYDRNGEIAHLLQITQDGAILSPTQPENGRFYKLYSSEQELRIYVESNCEWEFSKIGSDDSSWYEVSRNESDELIIDVSEYAEGAGTRVRTGTVQLRSLVEDGTSPVVKTIVFKQASPDKNRTSVTAGGLLDKTGIRSEEGMPEGKYTFYLSPFTASDCIYLYFFWHRDGKSFAELRFWLNTDSAKMQTELSCMPYCNDVNKWQPNLKVGFDNTKQVKIALDIMESPADKDGNTWIYSEWWLNDAKIAHATSDGIADKDGKSDNWRVAFADTKGTGYFRIWAQKGSATLDKWEYTSPIIWE